jgi:hypothetical protein
MRTLAVAAMLAAGAPFFGYFGTVDHGSAPPAAAAVATTVQQPTRYVISNVVRGTRCEMTRSAESHDKAVRLEAASSCDAVWPGLGSVVTLSLNGRGTAAMEDRSGKPVLLLAAGDGVAYEAIEPKSAMVTVSVAR